MRGWIAICTIAGTTTRTWPDDEDSRRPRKAILGPAADQYATFRPTFLYEIIWNLSLAAFLIVLGEKRRIRPPGLFALYVAGYSAFRIFEESVRIDYSVYVVGMRLNFWIAVAGTLGGLIWFTAIQWRSRLQLQRA